MVLVPLSLFARSDHRDTSDCIRSSQARLVSSYDSKSAFCRLNVASVLSCPQLDRNGDVAFLLAATLSLFNISNAFLDCSLVRKESPTSEGRLQRQSPKLPRTKQRR